MKRILLYLLLISTTLSCKKEKFSKEYIGDFKGTFYIDTVEYTYSNSDITIFFTNETKNNVLLNNRIFNKNGNTLEATLSDEDNFISQYTGPTKFTLKKNLFNDDIEGTFTTIVLSNPDDYASTGTVKLTAK